MLKVMSTSVLPIYCVERLTDADSGESRWNTGGPDA